MHTHTRTASILLAGLSTLASCQPGPRPPAPTAADYMAADAIYERNVGGLVKNPTVEPTWLPDGAFWYRRETDDGHEYVRFDPASGERTPLFDHAALARALAAALAARAPGPDAASGPDTTSDATQEGAGGPSAHDLGLTGLTYDPEAGTIAGSWGEGSARVHVECDLSGPTCEASPPPVAEPGLLPSPDGGLIALRHGDDLYVRDAASGAERRLTTDGAPGYSWGATPDYTLTAIPSRKAGTVLPPSAFWSPDGKFLVTARLDERGLATLPFVEWVPQDGTRRPLSYAVRAGLPGDSVGLRSEPVVFDVSSGRRVPLTLPAPFEDAAPGVVGWSVSRGQAFVLARTFGWKDAGLFRVDLRTGAAEAVVREAAETRFETQTMLYNTPNIRVLGDGDEAIWYSDRTGWGHLYLYDGQTGREKNAITSGEWAVIDIVAVDEARRRVYFTAGGREEGRDPYYRHLYRASLDGGEPVLLTDVDADHDFPPVTPILPAAPDPHRRIDTGRGVFLDTYSTVEDPPVTVLRSTEDGHEVAEVERADASALYEAGWEAPTREHVKASDGTTDLYAVYYRPRLGAATEAHPVIDAVYGGPQIFVAPRNFVEAYGGGNPRFEAALARLGFAVVTVDGRGTPGRSSAFRDAGYPEFTQVGIDDHVAAIRALADRHPEMDIGNVGIYGWSWGGTFSAQAILSHPEFYRVCVTGAGAYDYAAMYSGFEPFTGVPVYADGGNVRTTPDESPASWAPLDVTAKAANLTGKMLIIFGDLDENVPATQAFRLIDALTKANRPYDAMYLPNRTHAGGYEPYVVHRTWDYFVEHLMGVEPPIVEWPTGGP